MRLTAFFVLPLLLLIVLAAGREDFYDIIECFK